MTEQEWLGCTEPQKMVRFLRDKASDRKLRFFACACGWSICPLLKEKQISRKTIEFAERFADGLATRSELHGNAWGKTGSFSGVVMRKAWDAAEYSADHASGMVEMVVRELDREATAIFNSAFEEAYDQQGLRLGEAYQKADAASPADWVEKGRSARKEEQEKQTGFLRDIFGNPFRPARVDPSWMTPTVIAPAQTIYDDRAFDRMPELADALHDAGCDNEKILSHCRGPGPHVRGCWVVDLLLGKK